MEEKNGDSRVELARKSGALRSYYLINILISLECHID